MQNENRAVRSTTATGAATAGSQVQLRFFGAPRPFEPIAWLIAALMFAAMIGWVTGGATATFDQAALQWIQQPRSESLDFAAHVVSLLGSEAIGVVHILLLAVLIRRRRWELAIGLFVATGGAGLLNGFIKDVFDRPRPAEVYGLMPVTAGQVFSFPSGHAMVSAAFFYFLAYVSCPFLTGWKRTGWIGLLLLIAIVVGLARTYLGSHWLTDVIAGYLVGYVWAQTVIFGAHLLARRRSGQPACGCPGQCDHAGSVQAQATRPPDQPQHASAGAAD